MSNSNPPTDKLNFSEFADFLRKQTVPAAGKVAKKNLGQVKKSDSTVSKLPIDRAAVAKPAVAKPTFPEPTFPEPFVDELAVSKLAQVYLATLAVAKPAIAEPAIAEPAITEPVVADLEKQKKSERPLGFHIIDPYIVRNKSVGLKYKIGHPLCAVFLDTMDQSDREDFFDNLTSKIYQKKWREEYVKFKNLSDVEQQNRKNSGSKLAASKSAISKKTSSLNHDKLMFENLAKAKKMRGKSAKADK